MINDHYTMNLYTIINNFFTREEVESWFKDYELTDYLTPEQITSITSHGLWSKDKLAKKIVDHYLMQEIGFETMALFKLQVKVHMQEVMEKYLPLVYSSSIEYDPLVNVDFTETLERNVKEDIDGSHSDSGSGSENRTDNIKQSNESTGSSTSSSTNSGSGLNISSDTPMDNLNKAEILAGNYASGTSASENTNKIDDSTTTKTTSSGSSDQTTGTTTTSSNTLTIDDLRQTDENYTKRVKGNSGVSATAQKMIEQYRDNIIAIDKEIIDSCESLFMIIY